MLPLVSIKEGVASIVRWYIDLMLMFMTLSYCSMLVFSMEPSSMTPALFTRMSSLPNLLRVESKIFLNKIRENHITTLSI